MSLLLDALKKAEEAKRQGAAGKAVEAAGAAEARRDLALEPVSPSPTASVSPLPELSAHLATVDADLAAVSMTPPPRQNQSQNPPPETRRPPPPRPAVDTTASQEAVRNAFAAKRTPPPNRTPLWAALAAITLIAVGIGVWFWFQMQAVGSSGLAARPASPTAIPATPASLPPAAIAPSPVAPPPPPAETTEMAAPPPPPAERRAMPAVPAEADSPIRISRGELRIPPALTQAYEQMQTGDLAGASKSYEQVLRNDPRNIDALLGMAAIALRQGQFAAAETLYRKVLEADPKDANAQAGLINLRGQADPASSESRLKGLLAQQPESAALNFALGNLYAGQRRWSEAQLAYFNAHTIDPDNPDYLYNLAASLDQLHMPKLALDYYKAALTASTTGRPSFDPGQVRARITELQH